MKDKVKHESDECYVYCPFHIVGCKQKTIKAKEYDQHLKDAMDAHLVLILKVQHKDIYDKMMEQTENTGKAYHVWMIYEKNC